MPRTIANIRSFERMGIFSDRGRGSEAVNFRRYNLIYGFNGSGKSTLSRVFASLEAGALHERLPEDASFELSLHDGGTIGCPSQPNGLERTLLVFNSDYIERNLRWTAGVANPVFFIGSDQADAAAELTELENHILIHGLAKTQAQGEEAVAQKGFATFKKERAKQTAARLHLGSRKYEAPALVKDYEAWKTQELAALTPEALSEFEEIRKLSEPMADIKALEFDASALEAAYRFVVEMCALSLSTVTLEEVQRFPDMLLWLKDAHEFHRSHSLDTCLFCGHEVSKERMELLASAFDTKVDEFVERIDRTSIRLDSVISDISYLRRSVPQRDLFTSEVRPEVKGVTEELIRLALEAEKQLSQLKEALTAKRNRPATPADVSDLAPLAQVTEIAGNLRDQLDLVNSMIGRHNGIVGDFGTQRDKAETAIRRHFIAECRTEYAQFEKELGEASSKANQATLHVESLQDLAEKLRNSIRQHGAAAEMINTLVASYLGHRELTIHAVEAGYEIQRHGKVINGVPSEGEKTALALGYFLSSIEAEGRKLKDAIVVVDDPVSSLDTKALNYACSLVRSRLNGAAQVFVLTHNLQCMNEFRKAWKGRAKPKEGEPTASFLFLDTTVVEGSSRRSSKIVEMPRLLREYDSEYHFLFSHVLRFVNDTASHYEHGYMMPNVIRRVMDVFLAFKCPGNSGFTEKINKLCSDYPDIDRDRLAALERLVQVESHSDNLDDLLSFSSMTVEETKAAANALFDMMEQVDAKHLTALKRLCR